ncbi:DUF6266 family protein [Pedobacter sp. MC2016-24]|uniref:DUF6266 family protein n=1 Tax=Pedobacter sp. MC2016-24 TaxID=2780090 RepID=UPI00188282C8|nr:DUF6266 family protein [Pedobacter sp. MC2016-24]MBE9599465.1 hypothetical protein [Pedobacter sp. MC2016-24]
MGKYKKGILGPFRGKVGNVVGAIWRGIQYLKSLPDVSGANPTPAQLNIRAKLTLITGFLRNLKADIDVGYQQFKKGITPMNAAVSYHLKYAVKGVNAANYTIDYDKVMVSVGKLPAVEDYELVVDAPGKIKYTWTHTLEADDPSLTDRLRLVVYNPAKDKWVMLKNAAARSAKTYTLNVPALFGGDDVYTWMYFVSLDGKQVSDSISVQITLL